MTAGAAADRRMSFHDYIRTRRYQFGRGSRDGWMFVARALGDPDLPDAASWPELRAYLQRCGDDPGAVRAARVVWNSYLSLLTRLRRAPAPAPAYFSDGSMPACRAR